jgi:hypothetical protein
VSSHEHTEGQPFQSRSIAGVFQQFVKPPLIPLVLSLG